MLVISLLYVTLWFAGFSFPYRYAPHVIVEQEAENEEPDSDVQPVVEQSRHDGSAVVTQ